MGNDMSTGTDTTGPDRRKNARKTNGANKNKVSAVNKSDTSSNNHARGVQDSVAPLIQTEKNTSKKQTKAKVTIEESAHSFGRPGQMSSPKRYTTGDPVITDAPRDVRANYHINSGEIGHGHYSVVRKCMHRESKEWFAIKSILKSKVTKVEILKREIEILKEMEHPNIIKLYEVYEDTKYLHLVTELCRGGELFDRIIAKTQSPAGHFSEHDAAKIVLSILEAIAYCHDVKGIVHRDLKPENFLFLTKEEDSPIKIIDFGLSRHNTPSMMKTRVGTPYYVAPEVLNREYTKSCDIWSIGVITYILLCGYPPFYGDSDNQIFDSIRQGYFDFPSPEWDDISATAKDFICSLLRKQAAQRLTATQAVKHEWIRGQLRNDNCIGNAPQISHSSNRSETYKKFRAIQKLKKAALGEIATHLTKAEVGPLGDVFHLIDEDADGIVTFEDINKTLLNSSHVPVEVKDALKDLRDEMKDSDGNTLNWKAFLAATMDRHLAMREDKVRMAFDNLKKSGGNCMHVSDLVHIFGGQAQEVMGFVDTDGDGRISFEDFKKALADALEEDLCKSQANKNIQ